MPLLGELLGTPEQDTIEEHHRSEQQQPEENEATFARVPDLKYTGKPTAQDFERLEKALIPIFPEQYLETVSTVISVMYHDNQLIDQVAGLLDEEDDEADNERKEEPSNG